MKISTSLDYAVKSGKMNARDAAKCVKDAGFDGIDLNMAEHSTEPEIISRPEWENAILEQADAAMAAGLEIAQCHLPSYPGHEKLPGDGTYRAYEDMMLPSCLRALEICGKIGCKYAVTHPYFKMYDVKDTLDGNLKMIAKMIPTLEKYGIRLCNENVFGPANANTAMSYPNDLHTLVETVNHPLVGYCIDTGHANLFLIHIGNMARLFGSKLFALHINSNCSKSDEHTIPFTLAKWCEKVDYYDFVRALREIDYNGFFNMELCCGEMPPKAVPAYYNFIGTLAQAMTEL